MLAQRRPRMVMGARMWVLTPARPSWAPTRGCCDQPLRRPFYEQGPEYLVVIS
jgi:hypothetical protein